MQATAPARLWSRSPLAPGDYARLRQQLRAAFRERMRRLEIDDALFDALCPVYVPLAAWLREQKGDGPLLVGVNGAQGSGKSTLCEFLSLALDQGFGYRVAGFSIDDLYKTRAERRRLAAEVHPLLMTRGVPGTHDVALGLAVIDALCTAGSNETTRIPAFDKALDERRPEGDWPVFQGTADILILEGWCVGAKAQPEADLLHPVNELEATEDSAGIWRQYVNAQLSGCYAELFGRLDKLIMLKVPGMESVFEWRALQESKLAARTDLAGRHRLMDGAALQHFIMHYERLTRFMLEEMPRRADVTLFLDDRHRFAHIHINE